MVRKAVKKYVLKRDAKCVYCEGTYNLTIDHIIPRSRGQEYDFSVRDIESSGNIVAACYACNQEKQDSNIGLFLELNPEYKANFFRNARHVSENVLRATGLKE